MSFSELKAAANWPDVDNIKPYYFSVDGGGRDLIYEIIATFSDPMMIEVGCFLCGSTLQWLDSHPNLKIVGVDPWPDGDSIRLMLERYKTNPVFDPCFAEISDRDEFISSVARNGFYMAALANVKDYRDRFVPFRGKSPDALLALKNDWGVEPDIIYIDANKVSDDLRVAHELFPKAVLCGDDWTWGKDQGYPMRAAVYEFINQHGFRVEARKATWAIQNETSSKL